MTSRQPYHGLHRKLILGIDVGTTYSGVSFVVLDPGVVPEIKCVNRYPAQERVGGAAKIPSIIYYDKRGKVRAVGAEALQESIAEAAEEGGWHKVEWFKLHLRPKTLASTHINDDDLPTLPRKKTPVDVFGDFLKYLYHCAQIYIQESLPNGISLWNSIQDHIEFVLSHPNGWEGAQQTQMRRSAILGGLIPDNPDEYSRIQFVTEGEASLHYCTGNNFISDELKTGKGVILVDAGGGTIDLSAYYMKSPPFEEIAPTECRLQGSIFVTRRASSFLAMKLHGSRFEDLDDIKHISECFDRTTKMTFRDQHEPSYIKFGGKRDKDPDYGIRMGQLKLEGSDVAALFEPSIQAIVEAINLQREGAHVPVSTILLVGGFAENNWLFSKLQAYFQHVGLSFCRPGPDGHLNKAVADGAVSFYLDHFVSVRVTGITYGVNVCTDFDETDPEHLRRSQDVVDLPSGRLVVLNAYSVILPRGTQVSETTEFRRTYRTEKLNLSACQAVSSEIIAYRGLSGSPGWVDTQPEMFSTLCTIHADTSRMAKTLKEIRSANGVPYYDQKYSIILSYGLTEHKAHISWLEDGEEKRGPATIVYDQQA